MKEKNTGDIFVVGFFFSLFLLLNWRLFAFGSENQLFLYGDNLVAYNNLFYLFNHFSFLHPFDTLIGTNGMLGGYPMAEPQNSIFYPPIAFLFVLYKLFHFQTVGLYYELLFLHTAHFILGTFFVYKICQRIFQFSRVESLFAGLVYFGLGWNVAWFGTGTLSYMIGLFPLTTYVFLRYLQKQDIRRYGIFVLAITLFLYAGGLVNFFFYLLLNFFVLFTVFVFFKYDLFFSYVSKKKLIQQYFLLFIVAPMLGLLAYAVQLFATYSVSADIFHSNSNYDYMAFFGTHFYDLIGFIIPKFSLLQFGWVTNPQMIFEFSLANILYIGFLPVILLIFGAVAMKSRELTVLTCMILLNLLLSFGGAFPLYDATYFFPGNNLFRGHYKYLVVAGVYLAIALPFVLRAIRQKTYDPNAYKKVQKYLVGYVFALTIFAIIFSLVAFSFKVLQKDNSALLPYYTIALTFSGYFFRMILITLVSWFSVRLFVLHRNTWAISLLAFVLVVDVSVNFKYAMYYETTLQNLTSDSFFQAVKGKTIVNDMERYTQVYHIPEIIGVDPFFHYSAIPNRYLVDYNGHLRDSSGKFDVSVLRVAGIDGVLTTSLIQDSNFSLVSAKKIQRDNYKRLYNYNANGDLHNDWGRDERLISQTMYYYEVQGVKKAYFTNTYSEEPQQDDLWSDMNRKDFSETSPVLLVDKKEKRTPPQETIVSDASLLANTATYKKIALNNTVNDGLAYVNIPYSLIWKAKVNGIETHVYRANVAFSAVKVQEKNAVVEFFVNVRWHLAFFAISTITILLLISLICFPRAYSGQYVKMIGRWKKWRIHF